MLIPREPKNRAGKKRVGPNQPKQQQQNANRNRGGRRGKGGRQEATAPQEEKQRQYLEQLNQQAEIAMRVLEREKAELAVMKEKIVESRSSEGKRKIFDKSKIPGLSPRARDNDRIVAPPKRFDDIDVPTFQNDKFRQAEEEAFRRSIEAENLRSPGFDSPLHSPAPAEAAQYATPQRGLPAAPRQPSHPEDGPRRNLFQPDREIQDEDLPASVKKRMEILNTMRENKRRQMSHNSFWGVDPDPRVVSPQNVGQKNAGGFLSAMRDLQGGPSEEQRRQAELQRQKLLQDLDEQVRLKREEKRSANRKRQIQEEQAERRARLQALRGSQPQDIPRQVPQEPPRAPQPQPQHQAARHHHHPAAMPSIQEAAAADPSPPHHHQHHHHAPAQPQAQVQALAQLSRSPLPVAQLQAAPRAPPPQAAYASPMPRARRKFEIEGTADPHSPQGSHAQQLPLQQRSPGLAQLHHRAQEAGAPQSDAISALLSEIRQEQKILRQQFQEQMHVVSKLEEGARNASKEREIAMQELRKVKENIHPDSLDEFSVASHYVPKDVSEIPDEDRLSEVEIRMATVGKSFEDALNGFLINRESVYLDDDQDAEPTLSPMRNPYALNRDNTVIAFPMANKAAEAEGAEEEARPTQKPRTKVRRKKRTQKQPPPAAQRWKL